MTIRFNSGDSFGIPSGYSGTNTSDYFLPPCTVKDIDEALFSVFSDINFTVTKDKELSKAKVLFSAGERWAMRKNGKDVRDDNGTLILPLIAIHRMKIDQSTYHLRGSNSHTGEIVIKRRLDKSDALYQNLINKIGIKNQSNVGGSFISGTINTGNIGLKDNQFDKDIVDKAFLSSKYENNLWEFIVIPTPQYIDINYEITFWTQYQAQMNELIEKLMSAYLAPSNRSFKLETKAGYWFVGQVTDDGFTYEGNAEDYTETERIIKNKLTVKVQSFILGSNAPGMPIPVKRFVSAPMISFDVSGEDAITEIPADQNTEEQDGDPTLNFTLNGEVIRSPDNKSPDLFVQQQVINPFSLKESVQYLRVTSQNKKVGESILKPYQINDPGLRIKIK
jgi:hypothetical protein